MLPPSGVPSSTASLRSWKRTLPPQVRPFCSHGIRHWPWWPFINAILPSHSQSSSSLFPHSPHLISASFSSPILSTWLTHFNLVLTKFYLKLSFTQTSTVSPMYCWEGANNTHCRGTVGRALDSQLWELGFESCDTEQWENSFTVRFSSSLNYTSTWL